MSHYDIVIVGGGLVGMSLACALKGSHLQVALVERAAPPPAWRPHYDDRTLALAYGSRRILEGMGLWAGLAAQGATPIRAIHVSERGRFGKTRLSARAAGLEALGYVVEMPALGDALHRSLANASAVDWLRASVEGVTLAKAVARLDLREGEARRTIEAQLVVAADGARSSVRIAAGIAARTIDYGQSAVVANVTPTRAHGNVAYERFTRGGPLALLPMRGGRCTVVWSMSREQAPALLACDDTDFLQALEDHFGARLGRLQRAGRRVHYALALTQVEDSVGERLALVGNAAHTVHPVAGQGFNLGLRDVAVLAELIIDSARRDGDVGEPQLLARYARARRHDTRAVSAFTDGLIRLFSNDAPGLGAARSLGLVATDLLPPLKRALIRRTSGLGGRLPRLARGLPLCS